MQIRIISHDDVYLIKKSFELLEKNYMENMILYGDLSEPCINETTIYGIFKNDEIFSIFVVYNGFSSPSIVIPYGLELEVIDIIFGYISTKFKNFILPSFDLKKNDFAAYFMIENIYDEYCMITDVNNFKINEINKKAKFVEKKDEKRICEFYKQYGATVFTNSQLKTSYYYFIEEEEKIVACGGVHFVSPYLVQLGNIYVDPTYRQKGYGLAIVATITEKILKDKKYASLFVDQNNLVAINLYKKLGFRIYKEVKIFSLLTKN